MIAQKIIEALNLNTALKPQYCQCSVSGSALFNADCMDILPLIPDKSVQLILADLPYGTTNRNTWDEIIPFEAMWKQVNRIIADNGAILFCAGEPFTSKLICSNIKGFKYRWNWDKKIPSGMGYAKYRPMEQIEDICVFEKNGNKTNYYPQMIKRDKPIKAGGNNVGSLNYGVFNGIEEKQRYDKTYDEKNPTTLISFDKVRRGALHPTQKPVELMKYLISTYTKENDLVLDFTMGVGTTCLAAKELNRKFIGIEKEKQYYDIAISRVCGS